jgi:four helix bundle protein
VQDFRNLKVWQRAHKVVLAIYRISANFPKHELFALANQIRRAAYSVPMNIAEGCGRGSDADFSRFLQIALGSASELDYQLLLARDLAYLADCDHSQLSNEVVEIKRMLAALIRKTQG